MEHRLEGRGEMSSLPFHLSAKDPNPPRPTVMTGYRALPAIIIRLPESPWGGCSPPLFYRRWGGGSGSGDCPRSELSLISSVGVLSPDLPSFPTPCCPEEDADPAAKATLSLCPRHRATALVSPSSQRPEKGALRQPSSPEKTDPNPILFKEAQHWKSQRGSPGHCWQVEEGTGRAAPAPQKPRRAGLHSPERTAGEPSRPLSHLSWVQSSQPPHRLCLPVSGTPCSQGLDTSKNGDLITIKAPIILWGPCFLQMSQHLCPWPAQGPRDTTPPFGGRWSVLNLNVLS